MLWLILASLIWAFSFGLVKHVLQGAGTDMFLVAAIRMILSFAIFAPFLRPKQADPRTRRLLLLIGGLQYGVMYLAYLNAYHFLEAYQIALLTIFTPFYVALLCDLRMRRFRWAYWGAALIAVAGSWVLVRGDDESFKALAGVALVQVSNICFALGQVAYRVVMGERTQVRDRWVFAWLYLGGVAVTLPIALLSGAWRDVSLGGGQVLTLLYLGIIPSGVCFYFWNRGARHVNAGTLAVLNNAKIPLAVLVALTVFREKADGWRLALSLTAILVAVVLSEWASRRQPLESPDTP